VNLVGFSVRFFALILALSACGKSAEQCKLEAQAFHKQLSEAETEISGLLSVKAKLPSRRDFTHRELRMAPAVTVVPGGFTLDDAPITRDALRDKLIAERTRTREFIESSPRFAKELDARMVYLAIDEAVPWHEVVDAVALAAEVELTVPVFLFAYPVTSTPPPRAPIDDELDRIMNDPPGDRATRFAEIVTKLVADCPAMQKSFGQVGSDETKSKAQIIIEAIPEALIECKCKVPMDDFRAAMWRILVVPTPMRALVIDPAAPAQELALPATTTWGEASKRLTPATKNVKLVVR
jgi:hypothetical protein